MNQARLVYCSLGIDCQCFYFFYKGASIFYFDWMTKGMSQLETTGPALADYLGWESDLGRASCRVIGLCLSPNNCSACLKSGPEFCFDKFWAFYAPSYFSTTSDYQDTVASLFCLVDHSWHES
ncbi:hypothetical protein V6N13_104436 [Hibiscus sabdariffa]